MNPKWTPEQDAILREMYPSADFVAIMVATGRTRNAIYARAELLKLVRKNNGGFKIGNKIRNHVVAVVVQTLSDRILRLITDSGEALTTQEIRERLGHSQSSVTTAVVRWHQDCRIYIKDWRKSTSPRGPRMVAAYAAGDADDAPMQGPEEIERFHAPSPIPRPELCPIDMWAFRRTTQEIAQ